MDLNLSKNNFTEFPPILFNLKSLIVVNLSDNKISALPEKIWSMENLTALLLSNNNLSSIPIPKQFTSLKTLWIDGNSIPDSQIDAIKKAVPQIELKK